MKSLHYLKRSTLALTAVLISGCSLTGNHLSYSNSDVVEPEHSSEHEAMPINVYMLSYSNASAFNRVTEKKSNADINIQVSGYEYHVGVGDVLNITVYDHPELTTPAGSYRSATESGNVIHSDGSIFYPYIGKVFVNGNTVSQIRDIISVKLAKYIERPQIDVSVAAYRSQNVYVTGEVKTPNLLPITNVPLTLLDAINKSGGINPDANWNDVVLTRDGKEINVSLYALMQKGDITQNYLLQSNDIIHVPRNDSQKIFVMGEVNEPAVLTIDRTGMSLTEAIGRVNGLDQSTADATGVFVVRKSKTDGIAADIFQLDLSNASNLIIGTNFELSPYDVVFVTAAPIARWNRVVSQILPSVLGFNELSEGALRVRNW